MCACVKQCFQRAAAMIGKNQQTKENKREENKIKISKAKNSVVDTIMKVIVALKDCTEAVTAMLRINPEAFIGTKLLLSSSHLQVKAFKAKAKV